MNTGERIKKLRKYKEWTQSELGEMVGLTCGTMSGIESSRSQPTGEVIVKLSKLFNVSTDYLLTGKEESGLLDDQETAVLNLYRTDPDIKAEINQFLDLKKNIIYKLHTFLNRRCINLDVDHDRRITT